MEDFEHPESPTNATQQQRRGRFVVEEGVETSEVTKQIADSEASLTSTTDGLREIRKKGRFTMEEESDHEADPGQLHVQAVFTAFDENARKDINGVEFSPVEDTMPATVVLSRDSSLSNRRDNVEQVPTTQDGSLHPIGIANASSLPQGNVHEVSLQAQLESLLRQNAMQHQVLKDLYASIRGLSGNPSMASLVRENEMLREENERFRRKIAELTSRL